MPKQHLLETLGELQAELAAMQTVDPATRAELERVIAQIERQLDASSPEGSTSAASTPAASAPATSTPDGTTPATEQERPAATQDEESLTSQLQNFVLGIEAEHPRLTRAVNQVAAALANLGI